MATRKPKGEVSVESYRGFLRLRWRLHGERYTISLGLPDDDINQQIAAQKAHTIKMDILSGNFDSTLKKYRADNRPGKTISAVKLFQRFIQYKAKQVQPRTLEKYYGLVSWLSEHYGDRPASAKNTEEFIHWLLKNLEAVTAKERLGLLNACWEWGMKENLVGENPWQELKVRLKLKQMPKPFTLSEVKTIIQAFRDHSRCQHYADYVQFKFETGCRTGEANGLRWRHLNHDCSVVWFGEAHTHRQFKDTKTGKARDFKLADSTIAMLKQRSAEASSSDALVFPAPKGGAFDEGNFAEREWTTILESCDIN